MKKVLTLLLFVSVCAGCASVEIPKYLADKKPYVKKFYASYEKTLSSTKTTLDDLGWTITHETDPSVYESGIISPDSRHKNIIIFTNIRQTPLFLGTRYAKMNVLLREVGDGGTEVDIRYLTVNSLPFRNIESYNNESAVNRVFEYIAKTIQGSE